MAGSKPETKPESESKTRTQPEPRSRPQLQAVPLAGLEGSDPLAFDLYLGTGTGNYVLYRDTRTELTDEHLGRLRTEGVEQLFVRDEQRLLYFRRIESNLRAILRDYTQPLELRAEVLHGVAVEVAEDLLNAPPDPETVSRARRLMSETTGLMLRESEAFEAIRAILNKDDELDTHSLTVGFLSMGLVREVLGAEPVLLLNAGLAGLLHDVGRATHGPHRSNEPQTHQARPHDPEHTTRGHLKLKKLGLPKDVCDVALLHHERWDGSGYPQGLSRDKIPEMARLVGLVDTFQKVYAAQPHRVSIYEAMRSMAQAYTGCFDARMAMCFVKLFADKRKAR